MNPIVSIIIPSFNRSSIIHETLDSIINQTLYDWEAIVVDDGSTDTTVAIVKGYSEKDSRIKLFSRDRLPKGAPTCRNIGIENSSGEYLIFLDSDDILAPWCLEERLGFISNRDELDFAVFPVILFKNEPGDLPTLWNKFDDDNGDLEKFLKADVPWQTSSPLWKKSSLKALGEWNEEAQSWQDWEFHIRALLIGLRYKKVQSIPDVFIRRGSSDRISANNWQVERIVSLRRLLGKIGRYIIKLGNYDYNRALASNYLKYAENIIENNIAIDFKDFYSDVRDLGILNKKDFNITLTYLKLLKFTFPLKRLFVPSFVYRFSRIFISRDLLKNNSHSKVSLQKQQYDTLLKRLHEVGMR